MRNRRSPISSRATRIIIYDHPPIAAYRLNKLLYESRHKPALRQRMFRDLDTVCMEYGLGYGRGQRDASGLRVS